MRRRTFKPLVPLSIRSNSSATMRACSPGKSPSHSGSRRVSTSQTRVKRFYEDFADKAQRWVKERRVIAKIEWHPDELFPRMGFIVTNLPMDPDRVVRFYNQRGTAEQHLLAHAGTRCQATHQGQGNRVWDLT